MTEQYIIKQDLYGDWAVFKFDTILICGNIPCKEIAEIFCKELNKLAEESKSWQKTVSKYLEKLTDENKQLKKQKARYKRLSEIRSEEINNRILTIKEFIDDCSDEEVKKALKDLFYSEVNEYDLSKKYRKLHEENEVLKLENKMLKTTIGKNEAYIDRLTHKSDWSNNAKTSLRPKPVKNRRDMK